VPFGRLSQFCDVRAARYFPSCGRNLRTAKVAARVGRGPPVRRAGKLTRKHLPYLSMCFASDQPLALAACRSGHGCAAAQRTPEEVLLEGAEPGRTIWGFPMSS
jgi:hypothetical protein